MGLILNAKSVGESTCYVRSVEDLKNLLAEVESASVEKRFELKISLQDYNDEILAMIYQVVLALKQKNCSIDVLVASADMEFKMSEMESFIDLEDEFDKNDVGLYFSGGLEIYTLADTLYAQLKIDEIVQSINQTNASPFEKYLMAYDYVSSRIYKEYQEGSAKSRDLIAVLNGDDIVCVGYAKLMDRLCRGIGIESFFQPVRVYDGKGKDLGGHQNNIVYLKDDKYGIDGYYYSDACWDAVSKTGQHKRFLNHCLIPLSDKYRFKDTRIDIGAYRVIKGVKARSFYEKTPNKYDVSRDFNRHEFKTENPEKCALIATATEKLFLDDKKRQTACEKLAKSLQSEGIPENVYGDEDDEIKLVSKECSYEYMLALLMESQTNKPELSLRLKALKDYELGVESSDKLSGKNTILRAPANVYEKLGELASAVNVKKRRLGSQQIEFESPFDWRKVKEQYEILQMSESFVSQIKQTVRPGKVIPIEAYRQALKNNLLLQGFDEKTASYQADLVIDSTVRRSEFVFGESATNSFRQEALKRRSHEGGQFGE